jgi:hypothetical protein
VEERAAVNAHPAAAQLPIRAQQEVIAKDPVMKRIEGAAADELEIGNILFLLAAPGAAPRLAARIAFKTDLGASFAAGHAIAKTHITGTKDAPQRAAARQRPPPFFAPYACSPALIAVPEGEQIKLRGDPLHSDDSLFCRMQYQYRPRTLP